MLNCSIINHANEVHVYRKIIRQYADFLYFFTLFIYATFILCRVLVGKLKRMTDPLDISWSTCVVSSYSFHHKNLPIRFL